MLVRINATDLIICKNLPKKISTKLFILRIKSSVKINKNLVILYFKLILFY